MTLIQVQDGGTRNWSSSITLGLISSSLTLRLIDGGVIFLHSIYTIKGGGVPTKQQ